MKKKRLIEIAFLYLILIFSSCETDTEPKSRTFDIKGLAQKGPFQKGTTVTVIELDNQLKPTGRNFHTTVTDDFGTFEIPELQLESPFIDLMADGYYFNERMGEVSEERLVLKAITDLSDSTSVNINILTHISQDRIKYLVQNEAKSFKEAKTQSEEEILNIFSLGGPTPAEFEHLDLSKSGELNGKLLAISSILMGSKKVNSITSLLSDINLDLRTDGELNQETIKTDILTNAVLLDIGGIRRNLSDFYGSSDFNNFQTYCRKFIDQTEFTPLVKLNFPASADGNINLLSLPDNSTILPNTDYVVAQDFKGDENLLSGLDNFSISIDLQIISGAVDIPHDVINLTNWEYVNPSCASQSPCFVRLTCYNCANASSVPLKINVTGSGELLIRINVSSSSIPDNERGNGWITKYIKW